MNVHDSVILEDSLPPKEKDLGSFTIPCYINNICFEKALANLGASSIVMPHMTFISLGLDDLTPTKLIIELADKTIKHPKGIAVNVLIGIDKFIFPVDFVVLDIPEDIKVSFILVRPFFSTTHPKIDVLKRKFTLKVGNDKIMSKSDKLASNIIKRVYALGLRERMELDLEARLMDNEPLELRRNQVENLGLTIKDGEVTDEPMIKETKTRNADDEISFEQINTVTPPKWVAAEIWVWERYFIDQQHKIYKNDF
ncbi:DNA/RNA polymerases superfamily protein [Tanacetum coccineum]